MSNHIHLILRNRPDVVEKWTDEEVAIRWLKVFPGRRIEEHLAEPNENDVQMLVQNQERIKLIRLRLSDVSWFMRALSEPIARMANKQDECTGRFWEGRFKAQRIVDEAGLLACAMYVDLNPVRAAMAASPDASPHTSAFDRIEASHGKQIDSAAFDLVPITTEEAGKETRETPVDKLREMKKAKKKNPTGRRILRDSWLSPLTFAAGVLSEDAQTHTDGVRASDRGFLNIAFVDYLTLLRWTANQSVDGLLEAVPAALGAILGKLGIDAGMWRDLVWHWQRYFGRSSCVGSPEAMKADAEKTGHAWYHGQRLAAACFGA